jgi:hypothetical protein
MWGASKPETDALVGVEQGLCSLDDGAHSSTWGAKSACATFVYCLPN